MTLWKGRIATGMAESVATFTVSLDFDKVLAPDDLVGSRAHVKGLGKVGILTDSEVTQLLDTLDLIEEEFETGSFVFHEGDEDIHTAIERRVTELAGDAVGAKLHTGRSGHSRRRMSTCPATRTCSGPNRCCWPITSWLMRGRWPVTWTACW